MAAGTLVSLYSLASPRLLLIPILPPRPSDGTLLAAIFIEEVVSVVFFVEVVVICVLVVGESMVDMEDSEVRSSLDVVSVSVSLAPCSNVSSSVVVSGVISS